MRYFDRELSWLEFNRRVLEEAMDPRTALLERLKFQGIFHSNLDEFFMNRVARVKELADAGAAAIEGGGSAREQLARIRAQYLSLMASARDHFQRALLPQLRAAGVHLLDYDELSEPQREALERYFVTTVYPVLTPLAVDTGHPFPHISNQSLNLAVLIEDPSGVERFARVKIPQVLPRLLPVPMERGSRGYLWLEQLVAAHLSRLFRGMSVKACYPFRVLRDADLELQGDKTTDLLETIEESISRRRFGVVVQLLVQERMPLEVRTLLSRNLEIEPEDVYAVDGALGMADLLLLHEVDAPDLKDPPLRQRVPSALAPGADLFAAVRARDLLLHHPFDSFAPVVDFLRAATTDPGVLAVKQTLYRVGRHSPVVAALAEAANEGKQVAVLVELKARFDEENNIEWARALESAGVHVVYGDLTLKTHCKVLLIVRKEADGIRRYVHIGTGNYNARTARTYTDLSFFTCDPDIAEDVSALFNALTGYSQNRGYRKLLVSPAELRRGLASRIEREVAHARAGREAALCFKMNALTDLALIDVLYGASQAGVKIDLIIRGSCCLVPGQPGLSDNIRVRSIVGRFLEHSRIYHFRNGGEDEVLIGSADLMQRNLDRRVETLLPVEDARLRAWLVRGVLRPYLRDNQRARELQTDGTYRRVQPAAGEEIFDVQQWFLQPSSGLVHDTPVTLPPEPTPSTAGSDSEESYGAPDGRG